MFPRCAMPSGRFSPSRTVATNYHRFEQSTAGDHILQKIWDIALLCSYSNVHSGRPMVSLKPPLVYYRYFIPLVMSPMADGRCASSTGYMSDLTSYQVLLLGSFTFHPGRSGMHWLYLYVNKIEGLLDKYSQCYKYSPCDSPLIVYHQGLPQYTKLFHRTIWPL